LRRAVEIFIFTAFVLLLSVSANAQSPQQVPSLVLKDIHGRTLRLSDYRGKIVLLNFWATWCPPCRAEIPELVKWQDEYRSRGLQIIGVTYPPQKLPEVRRFARRARVNYPIALGTKEMKLTFTSSETLPVTIVIGKDGSIRDIIEGILLPEEFQEKIQPLLK
jgi:thiol-disulfide isomerase/thioredoxin